MASGEPVGFLAALRQLYGLLPTRRRRQLLPVLGLMLLAAVAELVLIAAAVAFLSSLAGGSVGSLGPLEPFVSGAGLSRDQWIGTVAPFFILAVVLASALRLLLSWSNQRFVLGVGHDLAVEAQQRILLQPYTFHVERSTSEAIAALDKIQLLVFGVLQQAMTALVAAVMGLFILALLLALDAVAAVTAIALLGLAYWLVSRITRARLERISALVGVAYDQRIRLVQESLWGIRDLILDQTQPLYLEEFRKVDGRLARAEATTTFIAGWPRYLLEGAALILVAVLAIVLSSGEDGLDRALPVLGAVALGGLRLMPLLQQAFAGWARMTANRSVIGQVLDLLALPLPGQRESTTALPYRHSTEMNQVSYAYLSRPEPVISGVSLAVKPGDRIVISGETGCGKSTLADLFMGLLQPQSGSMTVDGVQIGPDNVAAWQRNIAHVSQSVFLADASIARNIAFSVPEGELDMDRVRRAAEIAEIAGFINSLPDGFDTMAGERGVRLSGGQRQRIAIARALYKNAPILVLDEATNALDPETEGKVLAKLFADTNRTIVLIGHRPAAIGHCRMVRLEGGLLVED